MVLTDNRVLARVVAVCVSWYALIAASAYLPRSADLRGPALAVHLAALAVGFGTVLVVDTFGLLALVGRVATARVLRVSRRADPFIWGGFIALGVTGVALRPDLTSHRTAVSLTFVLVAALNGVWAGSLRARVPASGDLPAGLVRRAVASGAVSQVAWWSTILIASAT